MTPVDLLLIDSENVRIYYHKDTNAFDGCPLSENDFKRMDELKERPITEVDKNNIPLPSFKIINHRDVMRDYAKYCLWGKDEIKKKLFNALRYKDDYAKKFFAILKEYNLEEDHKNSFYEYYDSLFDMWTEENGLDFYSKDEKSN